jgi:hypothetical protein
MYSYRQKNRPKNVMRQSLEMNMSLIGSIVKSQRSKMSRKCPLTAIFVGNFFFHAVMVIELYVHT